jgi:hypothetical protein
MSHWVFSLPYIQMKAPVMYHLISHMSDLLCYQYIVVHSKFPATSCWPLVDSNQVSTGSVHMDNKGKPHRSGSWMTSCLLCHILLEHIWDMISRCIHALKHLLQFYLNWKRIYIESGRPCGYLVAVDKRSTTGCRKLRMYNNILITCEVSMYQKQVHL